MGHFGTTSLSEIVYGETARLFRSKNGLHIGGRITEMEDNGGRGKVPSALPKGSLEHGKKCRNAQQLESIGGEAGSRK